MCMLYITIDWTILQEYDMRTRIAAVTLLAIHGFSKIPNAHITALSDHCRTPSSDLVGCLDAMMTPAMKNAGCI